MIIKFENLIQMKYGGDVEEGKFIGILHPSSDKTFLFRLVQIKLLWGPKALSSRNFLWGEVNRKFISNKFHLVWEFKSVALQDSSVMLIRFSDAEGAS